MDEQYLREDERKIIKQYEDSTDGPWVAVRGSEADDSKIQTSDGCVLALMVWEYDAPFIAAARAAVPLLLSRLCEVRAQVEREKHQFAAEQLRTKFNARFLARHDHHYSGLDISEWVEKCAAELEKGGQG